MAFDTTRRSALRLFSQLAISVAAVGASLGAQAAEPLKIGYSDWPGWVAWQVAIEKNWFKEAGVDVKFEWFDYSASMDAFTAGKTDAVLMTNGDALVTGAGGGKSVMVMITDYSNGNDMIIAKPGIKTLADLKGKKVAVETGLVEHLLLRAGMKKLGMQAGDITIVNAKTNEMPQVLASKDIVAVGAWQPVANEAMKGSPGAKPIYTSADEPGLIYDVLAVNPASLNAHRADWLKVVKLWDRVVSYINDPKTQGDAVRIMAARSGVTPAEYLPLLKGTRLLTLEEGAKAYQKGSDYKSLYGSTEIANTFNWYNKVYSFSQKVDTYIDPSLTGAALKAAH
ncbi:ABC transporter substrate-binding protein [Ramlibacter sp.]|uniref:ABC transporter substrate-binding protein n=1 Tax=Ramlibacter sp. TaxID=1917967 RepID=UPI0026198469|nr:ABC transporter substrate-binding protein [Ramlibacter sp.]MDB5957739.1 transport system substrate-binding protein [Ramlibacter sp.]